MNQKLRETYVKVWRTDAEKKEIVHDICVNLNNELEQKNFYQLGQSIIYWLLVIYGFKEKVVINFKLCDFDSKKGNLLVNCNGENGIYKST